METWKRLAKNRGSKMIFTNGLFARRAQIAWLVWFKSILVQITFRFFQPEQIQSDTQ